MSERLVIILVYGLLTVLIHVSTVLMVFGSALAPAWWERYIEMPVFIILSLYVMFNLPKVLHKEK